MALTYEEIHEQLPDLFQQLESKEPENLSLLTKGYICSKLDGSKAGVYLISEIQSNKPIYVGRSKKLDQRIGKDHRAIQKSQATLSYQLWQKAMPGIIDMKTAREYMFNNYQVRMLPIEDEYVRTIFEVYAALMLNTVRFNSFLEH